MKDILSYKFEDDNLVIATNHEINEINFDSKIKQVEQLDSFLIVRINPKTKIGFLNENIFSVSSDGRILWQIEAIPHAYENSPYTGMSKEEAGIKICNWDGTDLIVNPASGKIIKKGYSK